MFRWPGPQQIQVYETEPKRFNTGLVDRNGNPIMKQEVPEPIGFLHFTQDDSGKEKD